MEIISNGYTVHLTLDEAKSLLKIIGMSSLHTLITTFDLTTTEADLIQSMYKKLTDVVPSEE